MRLLIAFVMVMVASSVTAVGNGFTYQGKLTRIGTPANGPFDFVFDLYESDVGGSPIGSLQLDDVEVSDGIFSVELDYGFSPFVGQDVWLEVSVREGSSTGGFQGLLPRQEITPTPYALHAEFVAAGSVGAQEVIPQEVQLRIDETCPAGTAMTSIESDGSVGCQSVATQVAAPTFAYNLFETINDQFAMAIGPGGLPIVAHSMTGETGVVLTRCNDVACSGGDEQSNVVDPNGVVDGRGVGLGIGPDGNPILSYVNLSNQVTFAKCNDAACSGSDETITTMTQPTVVTFPSNVRSAFTDILHTSDGLPVLAFGGSGVGLSLILIGCNDIACSGDDETFRPIHGDGAFPSMALGVDGLPVLAWAMGQAHVTKCHEATCLSRTTTEFDSGSLFVQGTAISIAPDANPVVAYTSLLGELRFAKCNDVGCTGQDESISVVLNRPDLGTSVDLVLGLSGLPVITAHDDGPGELVYIRCNDATCTGDDESISTPDAFGNSGTDGSVVFGWDGRPLILHVDTDNSFVRVVNCGSEECG